MSVLCVDDHMDVPVCSGGALWDARSFWLL
jgi:hypothetical protein